MTVVETPSFLRKAKGLLSEEERADLVAFLAENPQAGVIMPETGGVRKLRWARPGQGRAAVIGSSTTFITTPFLFFF